MDNTLEYLTDWLFHYNAENKEWAAIPRGTYSEYWNNYSNSEILRSKELNTLLEILHKTKGDKALIEKLVDGKRK
jgi:hypothetical protein